MMRCSVAVLLVLAVCCQGLNVAPECYGNDDCDPNMACYVHQCKDPCRNACGINASCRVAKHIPVCRCHEGFIGDPMEACNVPDCSVGSTTKATGKKKFDISSFKLNWFEAFSNCQLRGLRLATVQSKKEYDDLIAEIQKSNLTENVVWLGGNDLGREGQFVWLITGHPVLKYRNWSNGQPDNYGGVEHCLEIWKPAEFGMNDRPCHKESFFVCEYN